MFLGHSLFSQLPDHLSQFRCSPRWGHCRIDVSIWHASQDIVLMIPPTGCTDVRASETYYFHRFKLPIARHLYSDMVLLHALSFGPMPHQASRQFTRISFGPGTVSILVYRLPVFLSQTASIRSRYRTRASTVMPTGVRVLIHPQSTHISSPTLDCFKSSSTLFGEWVPIHQILDIIPLQEYGRK